MEAMKGSYAVLITPMTYNQEVDLDGLKKNIDWMIEEGIPGICVCGGTGEFTSLTKEERLAIAETSVKHVNGRIKCLVGTAAETTAETIMYTKHAEEIGADGAMIINPYYCLPTNDEILAHYKAISETVSIPIMVYNNPAHTGIDMKPELLAKIGAFENIEYVKDASGDLRRVPELIRLTQGKVNVFCGGEDLALHNFILGATGWICVCANIVPKQSQRLYELVRDGKMEDANELFEKLYPLLDMLENRPKAIQKVKESLNLMGRPAGPARLPRGPLNKEEEAELVNLLKSLELI